jgi:hypothetical protein
MRGDIGWARKRRNCGLSAAAGILARAAEADILRAARSRLAFDVDLAAASRDGLGRSGGMLNYVLVSLGAGVLFGVMDALINANPLAQQLYSAYAPVARSDINAAAGIAIDLVYGFAIAAAFLLLAPSLPGSSGLLKGLALGVGMWFFRVVMSVATAWMMHKVPAGLLGYQLVTGLIEMLVLGAFVGLFLRLT